jgi:hypothetical protein
MADIRLRASGQAKFSQALADIFAETIRTGGKLTHYSVESAG